MSRYSFHCLYSAKMLIPVVDSQFAGSLFKQQTLFLVVFRIREVKAREHDRAKNPRNRDCPENCGLQIDLVCNQPKYQGNNRGKTILNKGGHRKSSSTQLRGNHGCHHRLFRSFARPAYQQSNKETASFVVVLLMLFISLTYFINNHLKHC